MTKRLNVGTQMLTDIHTTDTFRRPMGVTEPNTHDDPGILQADISSTIRGPVDILMSTRAFAQAALLTSHKKTAQRVMT